MKKTQAKQAGILEGTAFPGRAEHHLQKPWYEQLLFWAGGIFSLWLVLCCGFEAAGLWVRESGAYKAYSALMWVACLLYAVSILLIFWDKARMAAFFTSLCGAFISLSTGISLSTADKLGYINMMNQTFTESIPFWWGHIIPALIFLLCTGLWLLSRHRRLQEEQMYELDLKEAQRREKRGEEK